MIITNKPEFVLYQTPADDGIAEHPLMFKKYNDVFEISDGIHETLVNYGSIKEFIEVLKDIQKHPGVSK